MKPLDHHLLSLHSTVAHWRCEGISVCPHSGYEVFSNVDKSLVSTLKNALLSAISGTSFSSSHTYHLPGNGGLKQALVDLKEALQSSAYPYIIRSDAKGYYENIEHHKLIRTMRDLGLHRSLCHATLQLCKRVICRGGVYSQPERGIPAGCAASPALAALYLNPLDEAMLATKGVRYIRYMDDWVILCKSRWILRRTVKKMHQILHSLGLQAHPEKTYIGRVTKGFDFLGVDFTPSADSQQNLTVRTAPSSVSVQRLSEKLQHHFSSCAQLYEQGRLKSLESVERYLKHWLAWSKGTGIALQDSLEAVDRALQRLMPQNTCRMIHTFIHWISHTNRQRILNTKTKYEYEKNNKRTSCCVVNRRSGIAHNSGIS